MLRDSFIIPRVKSAHLNTDKINQYFTWNKSPKQCKSFCFNRPILNSFLKIIFYLLGKKLWAFLNFSSFRTSLDFCHCLPTLRLCLQRSHCDFCFSTRKHPWPCLGHPEHTGRLQTLLTASLFQTVSWGLNETIQVCLSPHHMQISVLSQPSWYKGCQGFKTLSFARGWSIGKPTTVCQTRDHSEGL